MCQSYLEHVNITVSDPLKTADRLCHLFGWRIRWQGDAISGGHSIHVGTETHYIAVYNSGTIKPNNDNSYTVAGGLNHIGIVVENIDEMEKKVLALGFETHSHADYEPGQRFYFHDSDNVEFEVVSYD